MSKWHINRVRKDNERAVNRDRGYNLETYSDYYCPVKPTLQQQYVCDGVNCKYSGFDEEVDWNITNDIEFDCLCDNAGVGFCLINTWKGKVK